MIARMDLVHQVLDRELVDADDVPCGTVDDLELEGAPGEALAVVALLVGPGAWGPRLPALPAAIAAKLFGTARVRVPWSEVVEVSERVRLKSTAAKLGLGVDDRKAGRWLAKVPGSDKTKHA